MSWREITVNPETVGYCGLYCGACKAYLSEKCPGCADNEKATWCKIRICCQENSYKSCADCLTYAEANDCKKFNNFISKIFALIFGSNRNACIERIKDVGIEYFAREMTEKKAQCLKR